MQLANTNSKKNKLNSLIKILRFIWSHPLASKNRGKAFWNFFAWQLTQQIMHKPVLCQLVEDSVLLAEKGMAGATGNIYTGLLEFDDMAFVLHALRPDDLFADIGANIGVYSVLAAKNAGASVIAVEPIPSTSVHLKNNIYLNKITQQVTHLQVGVGNENGTLAFTNTMDSINHVVPNHDGKDEGVIEIQVKKLDDIFADQLPAIMKMDIEGYEWPALNGAKNMLASQNLKAIIIELNGCGNAFGFSDDAIHELLLANDFKPYSYNAFNRSFSLLPHYGHHNTIYSKDLNWAMQRVAAAKKYSILNRQV